MKERIKYELRDVTPESMKCALVTCPSIYEVARVECVVASCPAIYGIAEKPDTYFVIGKKVDPKEAGLAERVGEGEEVIAIPKDLLEMLRERK